STEQSPLSASGSRTWTTFSSPRKSDSFTGAPCWSFSSTSGAPSPTSTATASPANRPRPRRGNAAFPTGVGNGDKSATPHVPGTGYRGLLADLGHDQPRSRPLLGRADAAGLREPGRLRGLADVARLHVALAARLGRQQPDVAAAGQRDHRVRQALEEVAVIFAPPQQHDVDHVVVVLVDELVPRDGLDRFPELLVDVVVVADLLHHLARFDAEPFGQAALRLRLTRGRAHESPPMVVKSARCRACAFRAPRNGRSARTCAVFAGQSTQVRAPSASVFPAFGGLIGPITKIAVTGRPQRVTHVLHPLRKDSRICLSGLSTLRSTRATDCHVPRASRPPTTGSVANGGMMAGITCDRPCPGEPCACRQRSSAGSRSPRAASRSSSLPAPSSMIATPAVACGTKTCSSPSPPADAANLSHSAVMSCTVSRAPVDTRITVLSMTSGIPDPRPRTHPGPRDLAVRGTRGPGQRAISSLGSITASGPG